MKFKIYFSFEKCKEIQLKANNLKEDEKRYKMIKRQVIIFFKIQNDL